jgi:hypothetical protein
MTVYMTDLTVSVYNIITAFRYLHLCHVIWHGVTMTISLTLLKVMGDADIVLNIVDYT